MHHKIKRGLGLLIERLGVLKKEQNNLSVPDMNLRNMSQFLYQQRLFNMIRNIEGDIVECGVGRGHSFLSWALLCHSESKLRKLWGFDSFDGFPEPSSEDKSPREAKKGEWGGVTLPEILQMLEIAGLQKYWLSSQITLVKGFFEESLNKYTGKTIALLHLDVDLYLSYKTALNILYPKVLPGGIIAFDEYMGTREHYKFPGAKRAIDEYFSDKSIVCCRDKLWGKYYAIKN